MQNTIADRKVYKQLDIMKIVLAIIVLCRHLGQSFFLPSSFFMRLMNIVSPVAVPLFFMASSYLFFNKKRKFPDLKKYVYRVLKLYVVWTIVALPFVFPGIYYNGTLNIKGWIRFGLNFLFYGSCYHLWFLPALIFGMMVTYALSKLFNEKTMFWIAVIFYIVGTLFGTYGIGGSTLVGKIYLSLFFTPRNGLFFAMPFCIFGYLVSKNYFKYSKMLLLAAVLLYVCEGLFLVFVRSASIIDMPLSSLIFVPICFVAVLSLPNLSINTAICRPISTFMFCCHPFIIKLVSYILSSAIGGAVISACLTLLLSIVVSKIKFITKVFT